jgi:hypothetical protein
MKKLILFLLVASLCYASGFYVGQSLNELPEQISTTLNKGITFIWNDDEESIPVDSTPIMLEFTSNDTIYLGALETEVTASEYQFTITGDSMTVKDFDRHVGTVKVEGQLEQLLIKDNE